MQIDWTEIDKLKPHPKNRNQHPEDQIERLAELIKHQGWRNPIIVSKRSGFIAAGHGRLSAAKKLGLEKVPVHYQDFESEEQEYAFLTSDNAIASWAELDLSAINVDIQELGPDFDIKLLGIKDFVLEPAEKYGGTDEDSVPEIKANSISKVGDLFLLGGHRLLCGDSTQRDAVERLMAGEKADMVFTDPPYGMNANTDWSQASKTVKASMNKYGGNTVISQHAADNVKAKMPVFGDDQEYNPEPLLTLFAGTEEIFLWGGDYFGRSIPLGGSWVVWDKQCWGEEGNKCPLSLAEFELCWSKQKHQRLIAKIKWLGIMAEDTINRVHPTQKPVKLAEWFFERWGKEANLIWDGYLGSGSTLIACEKTNRRCFGMEIEPLYCDVILDRWAKFTGKDPVREDGAKWADLKSQ